MKKRFGIAFLAISLTACINDSESISKNGDIFRTWRFSYVHDGFLCTFCNPSNPDTTKIDLTFFEPDSFSEISARGSNNFETGRSGRFLRRNDSIFIISSIGHAGSFAFDSAEIMQLDYHSLVLHYNRAGSPFTMRFEPTEK